MQLIQFIGLDIGNAYTVVTKVAKVAVEIESPQESVAVEYN